MSLEVLSDKQVNRLYLIKHHLLREASRNDVVKVVGDLCGLHAQASTTPYLSLWNRVKDFDDGLLDKALYRDKSLVKTWCMRGTLHVIPSEDLPIYNKALRTMWFEHHGRFMRAPDWPAIEKRQSAIYPKILEALAKTSLTRSELSERVRSSLKDDSMPYQRLFSGWGGILKETAFKGLTVHAQPCERESCFARLDQWLPNIDLEEMDEDKAKKELLLRYLRGYGPASRQDFCLWSGLVAGDASKAIESAGPQIEEVQIEGKRREFLMLEEDIKAVDRISLDEEVPPILFPKFDSILLGHKDRTRIIRDEYKSYVFKPRVGDIAATVLVDGQIVATWRQKKTKKILTIMISPFEKINKDNLKAIKERAELLRQYMGLEELKLLVAGKVDLDKSARQ